MEKFYSSKALLKMTGGEGCIPLDPPLIINASLIKQQSNRKCTKCVCVHALNCVFSIIHWWDTLAQGWASFSHEGSDLEKL